MTDQWYPEQPRPERQHPGQHPGPQYPLPHQQRYRPQGGAPGAPYAPGAYEAYGAPGEPPAASTATLSAPGGAPGAGSGPGSDAGSGSGSGRGPGSTAAPRRTGDPIIAPGLLPAVLTAVLAVLLALAATASRPVLAVPVLLLQAVTAAGWYRLNGMWPARQGIALAFLGGVTADIALLATGDEHATAAVVGTLGLWCVLVVTAHLRNTSSPDERLYALTAAIASSALAVLGAGLLAAEPDAVTAGALGVAVTALVRALPLPSAVSLVAALPAAAGAGAAAGLLVSLDALPGALLGLAAGVCALIGLRVASYDFPSRFVHMTAGVALPLTAAVPAVYLLGRALG
ncbi:hypothetical protein CUT44_12430 [Streptomyces carminius]|uniref:Uncharacterized protein n=1 Tax=Streptomyces carminius TaxID=2665496 RepID=A0A2M8LZV0_9ACTN|nr:hypothetical protein [Streptomyces carminius]PJE97481.1 hypothetical protein CUT44_12430 [Streptomyces carminius]